MEEDLLSLLKSSTGLTALIGNKINWVVRPQNSALPAICLTRISGVRDYHLNGASGFVESRIQVDVFAQNYSSIKAVTRALIDAISVVPFGHIQGIFIASERDLTDANQAELIFQTAIDLRIDHT